MKTTKQIKYNRISILFSITAILLFPFISKAQLNVYSNGNVGIVSSGVGQALQIGTFTTSVSTATPNAIDLGGTYSNSAGTNLKLRLFDDGSQIGGFGISASQMDYKVWSSLVSHVFYQGTTELMRIKGNGRVGIGTANPGYALDVVATNTVTVGINTNGKVNATGGYTQVSDRMFKKDINSLPNALATISSLKPKSYYFDTAKFNGVGKFNFESVKQYGFIAQDVETILPELVSHYTKSAILDTLGNVVNPEYEFRALNYDAFIPILTKGIQELQQKNDSLQTKVNNQDSINVALQNQLNNLVSTINACCNAMNANGLKSLSDGVSQTNVELNNSQTIVLEQNVPNPFAEQTTINYFLPDNTVKAQMLFYNVQGLLIQSVNLTQKGNGALNVFANDLSSGIYSYTLVVDGNIIETKKMVKQ